eukprot:scaffold372343_cov50-Prasinocladus_malaysianus.AAC.1
MSALLKHFGSSTSHQQRTDAWIRPAFEVSDRETFDLLGNEAWNSFSAVPGGVAKGFHEKVADGTWALTCPDRYNMQEWEDVMLSPDGKRWRSTATDMCELHT